MNCQTCKAPMSGRKRKYCKPECRPSYQAPVGNGLENCQACGKSLIGTSKAGRPKRNCSKKCSDKFQASKKRKAPVQKSCLHCSAAFTTARNQAKFCSAKCRYANAINTGYSQQQYYEKRTKLYPDGTRTHDCGWCGQPRTFVIGESVVNAFHDDCRAEAKRAKNRTKTVKRKRGIQSNRISPDQVVKIYGSNCHICTEPIDLTLLRTSRFGLTIDHVIPLAKGGLDVIENLKPAHWICNIKKSDKLPEEVNA